MIRITHAVPWTAGALVALGGTLGCGESDSSTTAEDPAGTWHGAVAPIVSQKCAGCHTEGGIAPFSMDTPEDAAPWAEAMVREVEAGTMPPFLAEDTESCVPRHGFTDDIRLSAAEKATIARWAAEGARAGDADDAAPLPEPPALELVEPDLSLTIQSPVEIDGVSDQFWCFVLEPGLSEDSFYSAVQIEAGNSRVVHHVLVYQDNNDRLTDEQLAGGKYECFGGVGVPGAGLITAWAPGGVPNETPSGVAFRIQQGKRLVMQVHYHPTGEAETDDATAVHFRSAEQTPEYIATTSLIGNLVASTLSGTLLPGPNDPPGTIEFRIPAGETNHTESIATTFTSETIIYGAATHMHYVGTDMSVHLSRARAESGEPDQECLVQTPRWDFNWQRGFRYDAPLDEVPVARPGDRLLMRCTYNNSLSNRFVRDALAEQGLDAPRDVFMGEETLDEMCLAGLAVATPYTPE